MENDERMKQYHALVVKETSQFEYFAKQRIPWGQNENADRLSKLASSVVENLNPGIFTEYLPEPSVEVGEGKEVNMASPEPE